jgi:hypothetical protein
VSNFGKANGTIKLGVRNLQLDGVN